MRLVTFWFGYLSLFYQLCPLVAATLLNITVDDQFGDPVTGAQIQYTPPEAWYLGPNSTSNTLLIDPQKTYNRTWHESFFTSDNNSNITRPNIPRLATFTFTGSAVYITCIIAPNTTSFTGTSDIAFVLDGSTVGTFQSPAPASGTFKYNQTAYANESLPMATHSLIIQSGHTNGQDVAIFLDSVTYSTTVQDSASSTQPKPASALGKKGASKAVIIGAVIGSLAVLPLCGLAFFLYRRRSHRHSLPMVQSSARQKSVKRWQSFTSRVVNFLANTPTQRNNQGQAPRHWGVKAMRQTSDRHNAVLGEAVGQPSPPSHSHVHSTWTQSITAWQQNTHQATQDVELAPPDMSEELSSYYDDATQTESRRPRTPPPPPRHFTVRNT